MPRRYLQIKYSIRKLALPVLLLSAFYGVIQDLILPLTSIGTWTGAVFFIISAALLVIPEKSSLSLRIRELTEHWKFPMVFASVTIGIGVIGFSMLSKNHESEGGYIAANYEIGRVLQARMGLVERQISEIQGELKLADRQLVETEVSMERVLAELSRSSAAILADLGISVSNRLLVFQMLQNYSDEELELRARLLRDTGFSLKSDQRVFAYIPWGNTHLGYRASRLPRTMPVIHQLVFSGIDSNRLAILLDVFDDEVIGLKSAVSNGYAVVDYGRDNYASYIPLMLGFEHPLSLGDILHFSTPYSYSLITYLSQNEDQKRGGYNLLHAAAVGNNSEIVAMLLNKGVDPKAKTYSGYTPISLALEHHSWDVVEALLELEPDLALDSIALQISILKTVSYILGLGEHPSLPSALDASGNPYLRFLDKLDQEGVVLSSQEKRLLKEELDRTIANATVSDERINQIKTLSTRLKL